MKTADDKWILLVAFAGIAAQSFGQHRFGSAANRPDVTLLTGPYLLSPASPLKSPMPNQEWVFVTGSRASSVGFGVTLEEARRAAPSTTELEAAKSKLDQAKARRDKLRAERDALLQQRTKDPAGLSSGPSIPGAKAVERLRFDGVLPPTDTQLIPKPTPLLAK